MLHLSPYRYNSGRHTSTSKAPACIHIPHYIVPMLTAATPPSVAVIRRPLKTLPWEATRSSEVILDLAQRVHVHNNWVLGFWVIEILVQVWGKYMIVGYLDP